jgi:inner membrane protein
MLAKDHIQLSILSASLPILFSIIELDLDPNTKFVSLIIIMVGVFIGSLLPDTDLDESKIDHMYNYKINTNKLNIINKIFIRIFTALLGLFTFFIGKLTKYILNPIVALLFRIILRKPINRNHRGITHSIFGIFVNCLIMEGLCIVLWKILVTYNNINISLWYLSCLIIGLFIGEVLHLLEDSCTISGILPFYPLFGGKFSGNLRTGDTTDHRPIIYACILTGAYIGAGVLLLYKIPNNLWFLLALSVFLLSWLMIMIASKSRFD